MQEIFQNLGQHITCVLMKSCVADTKHLINSVLWCRSIVKRSTCHDVLRKGI